MTKLLFTLAVIAAVAPSRADAGSASPRYKLPCTPEAGYAWCFAPNRDAAVRDLPDSAKRELASGVKRLLLNVSDQVLAEGTAKANPSVAAEARAMKAAVLAADGESLFLTMIPRNSKPTIQAYKDGSVAHQFQLSLDGAAGSRKPFMSSGLIGKLAELDLYCDAPELVLYTELDGTPKGPAQDDLTGCTPD